MIRNFLDTLFNPFTNWLTQIYEGLSRLSVPAARPLRIVDYFSYFSFLGTSWQLFIQTVCVLAFIYFVIYILVNQIGLLQKIKDLIPFI